MSHDEITAKMARILRATRKQRAMTQMEMSNLLEITQGTLSKIENGEFPVTAPQWIRFCQATGVPLDSVSHGFVDFLRPAQLEPGPRTNGFRLPKRYAPDRGCKVRSVMPFLLYFEAVVGKDKLDHYLEAKDIDRDFFICMDNQINFQFMLDIAGDLETMGKLGAKALPALVRPINTAAVNGQLQGLYDSVSAPDELVRKLIETAPLYGCDYKYEIRELRGRQFEIVASAQPHLERFADHPLYRNHFFNHYLREYYKRFSTIGGGKAVQVQEVPSESDQKCTFRIALAG
jgi:transcriptional regulator with XRE-family HTH domain